MVRQQPHDNKPRTNTFSDTNKIHTLVQLAVPMVRWSMLKWFWIGPTRMDSMY